MERFKYIEDPSQKLFVDSLLKQLADAQATIAALQARVQELEAQHEDLVERNRILRHRPDLPVERTEFHDRFVKLQSQLTQRTAELEAAKKHCEIIEERKAEAYKEVEIQLLAKAEIHAELERVRGELQSAEAGYFVAERELQGANNKYDELRTLIAALPKVEGEIMVSESLVLAEDPDMCSDMSDKEEATAYAALLKRRQGMEG